MWYSIFRIGSLISIKLLFRLKVEGKENIPQKSNFIIVANHSSFLDPLVVAASVPRTIHCIVSRDVYLAPFLGWILEKIETLPAGRTSNRAIDYLMNNKIVGLFPEGRCSRDGKIKEFRRGVALLAIKTGRPILPCAVTGTFEALPVGSRFPKFVNIKVSIGKPLYLLKEFDDVIDDIYLQEGANKIRSKVEELLNAAR